MIISIYGFPNLAGTGYSHDVTRLATQVVTGVGFLGAGAIIHRNSDIKGLTTAGTIWAAMTIGIACGSFNFLLATIGTILIVLVITAFKKVELKIGKKNPTIILTMVGNEPTLEKNLTVSKAFDCTVQHMRTNLVEGSSNSNVEIPFQAHFDSGEERLMEYISQIEKETKAINVQILARH